MASLFDPIAFGAIAAPNRIMMAPLTRGRGTRSHVPTPLMGEYYSQRASAAGMTSARGTRNSKDYRGLQTGGRARDGGRFRWRAVTRRERLLYRSISERRNQPAHRQLWRQHRKPYPTADRGDTGPHQRSRRRSD